MDSNADMREIPALFVRTMRQFTRLMQDEVALAKAEVSHNLSRARAGLVMIGLAALLALTALDVLAAALVAYLAEAGLTAGTAALVVGGGLLAIALALVLTGKSRLAARALGPGRSAASLRTDLDTLKESTHA